ncbi:hypothetical protein HPB50_018796 [Hyalomma asiaticum]|uniref:Uncharacterized protein n=1 Tax=Hyalomma asiaticum TaxID=266040 RepID=A0ACB7S9P7_HYAAI|nr:hypothetical protein HPB50_018796 [Hyalomma asiaticum]
MVQACFGAAARDARSAHKKALLLNGLGVESLHVYLWAMENNTQPRLDRGTKERPAAVPRSIGQTLLG